MSVDPKILDRLKKLMEMADRGTEAEAAVAAERAAELMAKHQLDVADVEAHKAGADKPQIERGRIDAEEADPLTRLENWNKSLLAAISDSLGARAWIQSRGKRGMFRIIGPVDSVSTARYLYLHLSRQVNRLSREAGRLHGETSNAWRRSYAIGMVARVWERLKAGRAAAMSAATSTALVWVDKTKQAIDAEHAEMNLRAARHGARKRPDAGSYGYRDGDRVDLGSGGARLAEGQKTLKS